MKYFYLFIIFIFIGCSNNEKPAMKLCSRATGILSDKDKVSNADSVEYALRLITEAIYLYPDYDYFYLVKGYNFIIMDDKDSAINLLKDRWEVSKDEPVIAVSIGALYEDRNDILLSKRYYKSALDGFKLKDTMNLDVIMNIKHAERLLTDSVDFTDSEQMRILDKFSESIIVKEFKYKMLNASRRELIDDILK